MLFNEREGMHVIFEICKKLNWFVENPKQKVLFKGEYYIEKKTCLQGIFGE